MAQVIEELKRLPDTSVISFRVPLYVRVMYRKLPPEAKSLLRDIIVNIITSGKLSEIKVEQRVVNLNINLIKNEVSPQINVNSGDPEIAKEYVKSLQDDLKKAKEVIKKKNEEIKQFRRLIDKIKMFAKAGDIHSIRKVLGV